MERKLQRARNLGARNLAHTAALIGALDCRYQSGSAGQCASRQHDSVVRLRDDPLQGQPRRLDAIEGTQHFTERARIENGARALARVHFNKAVALEKTPVSGPCCRIAVHARKPSAACAKRSITVPGVAPKSLISIDTAPSKRAKNRSSTFFQVASNPSTLVFTTTCVRASAEGSSNTSRSPDPTTPTCTRCATLRVAG